MTNDQIFQIILQAAREVEPDLDGREITQQDSLRALGLDSMQRVEIVLMAMESIEIDVPRGELNAPRNLGELTALFETKVMEAT